MPYQTINFLANRPSFKTAQEAQTFLDSISKEIQAQLIAAMYVGREHLYQDQFKDDYASAATSEGLSRFTDHIPEGNYAEILSSKGDNPQRYFGRFVVCAKAAGLM